MQDCCLFAPALRQFAFGALKANCRSRMRLVFDQSFQFHWRPIWLGGMRTSYNQECSLHWATQITPPITLLTKKCECHSRKRVAKCASQDINKPDAPSRILGKTPGEFIGWWGNFLSVMKSLKGKTFDLSAESPLYNMHNFRQPTLPKKTW